MTSFKKYDKDSMIAGKVKKKVSVDISILVGVREIYDSIFVYDIKIGVYA